MGKGEKKCSVSSCVNSDIDHHMHTFPGDKNLISFRRLLVWMKNTGNLALLHLEPCTFYKRRFVCGDHFDDSQYVDPDNKRNIKRNAVPTLHCPLQLSSQQLIEYVSKYAPQFRDDVLLTDDIDMHGDVLNNKVACDDGKGSVVEAEDCVGVCDSANTCGVSNETAFSGSISSSIVCVPSKFGLTEIPKEFATNVRKGEYSCEVPYCGNSDIGHSMHTFPQVKNQTSFGRCLAWIERVGKLSLLDMKPSSLYKRRYVCGAHFEDSQYCYPAKRCKLKSDAVPTILNLPPISSHLICQYKCKHAQLLGFPVNILCEETLVEDICNEALPMDLSSQSGSVGCTVTVKDKNYEHFCVREFTDAQQLDNDIALIDHDYMNHNQTDTNIRREDDSMEFVQCDDSNTTGEMDSLYVLNNEGMAIIPAGEVLEEVVINSSANVELKEPKRISKRCCVQACSNTNISHSMFRFPRVERKLDGQCVIDDIWLKRCQEWVKFCANDSLKSVEIKLLHSKSVFVCSAHFKPEDFCGRLKLHKNSIPSLHGNDLCCVGETDNGVHQVEVPSIGEAVTENAHQRFSKKLADLKSSRSKQFSSTFERDLEILTWKSCDVCHEKYIWYPGIKKAHRKKSQCIKFSNQNNMDPGNVPEALQGLTFIEEQLIARVHPVLSVHKIKGCQYGYKGNVINFVQDVEGFASKLPHRIEELKSVMTVRFENNKGAICDFQVRAHKVKSALLWLKEHNQYYKNIVICPDHIKDLPEDGNVFERVVSLTLSSEDTGTVGEEERESENEDEDELEGDKECYSHVESSGVPCNEYHNQNDQVNAALSWPTMDRDPVSENQPGFIMCAFPTLFPYGNCDLKDSRESEVKLHEFFKHFMAFSDERFAKHPTFRFFAFNMWQRHTALSSGNLFMKKDPVLSKMNVDQLKQYLKDNPSYMKKMMFMGSNIRGSKSFWKSRCGELKDMVEQIGLPTIFLTMSAADMYWPDLYRLLTGKHITDISMGERRRLLQENPLVVDMFFQYRLECFIEHVLEPKYQVTDFWYRIEYQHRGSPHFHGLLWFRDAPDITKYTTGSDDEKKTILQYYDELVCAVNPVKDCNMPDVHPCEKKFGDVVDVETDLAQLLKNVQRHTRCSPEYCQRIDKKTKKTVCRFHFPISIEECSRIEVKDEGQEIEFKPERNDERLNKFNPFVISTWRANIDISPVLSKRAILEYLAKYVSKSEVASQTLKEISASVCASLDGGDKAKRAIQKILMKNCVQRDISAQEVCHILMGLKLYSSGGRNFVVVHTNPSDWTPVDINEGNDECNEAKSSGKSFLQKYSERPQNLDAMSMWHVAKHYNSRSWNRAKKQNIVRVFPRLVLSSNKENNEEYYRQKVLLHVPWRTECSLKADGEKWRDVYDKYELSQVSVSELTVNVNEYRNNNQCGLEDIPQGSNHDCDEDWMIASRISARGEVDGVELGRREVDLQYDWYESLKKYEVFGDINYFSNFIEEEKRKDTGSIVCDELPEVTFSSEQTAVKNLMEQQIKDLKSKSGSNVKRVLVQGKAGTGKSLLIKFLCQTLRSEIGDGSYMLLGPTGVAAINIGGSTVHSALHIPPKMKSFNDLKGESARKFCDEIENVKFIIIDEYSMVGCCMLGMIDRRLREGTGVNEPFGGLYVYFFGDYKQLPPVKDTALYGGQCSSDLAVHGREVFRSFEAFFVLTQGHRQKDVKFQQLLDRLSVGDVTPDDYDVLKTRFKNFVNRGEEEKFSEAIRLFSTKEEVSSYNLYKLYNLKDENGNLKPVARIPAKHHGKGASYASADQANGLSSVLYLAKGCKIMLRANLWVKRGLVNGSVGSVVDIIYENGKQPPNDTPAIIMCKFDTYTGPGIGPDNLVPIAHMTRTWTPSGGQQCSRQQFPIAVCYGCSIHKSQGLTMEKAVINIGPREFALGLTYVGLSRVKSLEGVLLEPFPYQRLQVIKHRPEMLLRKQFESSMFM